MLAELGADIISQRLRGMAFWSPSAPLLDQFFLMQRSRVSVVLLWPSVLLPDAAATPCDCVLSLRQRRQHGLPSDSVAGKVHRRPAVAMQPRMAVAREHRRIWLRLAALNARAIA